MINLDIDVNLLAKYAYLIQNQNLSGVNNSQNTQETDAEGQETKFYKQSGYTPANLVQDLDLKDPKVKYAILKQMKESDIMSLLPLLDKKAMMQGLKFFTKDKLAIMLSYLPEDILANVCMQMFAPKEMLELMPNNVVRKFLTNDKIEKKNIMKYMKEEMKASEIQDMYLQATGKSIGTSNREEMLNKMSSLKPEVFDDALMSLNPKQAKGMAAFVIEEQPEMLKEFSGMQLGLCFDKCTKLELVEGMGALETDAMARVLENLPPQLLEQVVTQIDPEVFAEQLMTKFPDVLEKMF